MNCGRAPSGDAGPEHDALGVRPRVHCIRPVPGSIYAIQAIIYAFRSGGAHSDWVYWEGVIPRSRRKTLEKWVTDW